VTSFPADPSAEPIRPRLRVLLLIAALTLAVSAAGAAAAIPSSAFTWTELTPATKPPAREGATMAYDPASGQLILFGGSDNGNELGDTWAWTGTDWEQLAPTNQPPARFGATMAYDPAGERLILFGGTNGGLLNDTWAWDGTDWEQLTPTTQPPARYFASMAYDPASGRLILFGGNSFVNNDTWAWDGTNWEQLTPTKQPPARFSASMAYDPAGERLILFGGSGPASYLDDTWAWGGTEWEQLTPTASPPARLGASMAYDDTTGQLILFGGEIGEGAGTLSQETWSYHPFAPPTATITGPADGAGYLLNQSVPSAFTCAEAAEAPGVQSCLDSNGAGAGTGTLDTGSVGPHTYTVTATSKDGLSSTSSIHYTVSAPPVPPTPPSPGPQLPLPAAKTTIHYSPNHHHSPNRAGGPRYTFHFAADLPGVSFYCSLDKGPFKLCSSPRVYRNLKPGKHVFRLKSVDSNGLESPVQTVKFRAGRRA
jgi:hypothetical protein